MSQFTDEQIQKMVDAGSSTPDTGSAAELDEARLYQQLFDGLKQDLPIRPDSDFSARVMSRIEVIPPKSTSAFPYGWLALGVAICLFAGVQVIASFEWAATDLLIVFASLKPFKWVLIFGMSSLLLFQFLDLKLIREPFLTKLISTPASRVDY